MIRSFSYANLNNLLGWILGLVALLVYGLTVEPTASLWDCSEFIAVSHKLEVPHPPGAPLYLMIGRMFSLLAAGNVEQVAYWVNILSVLASALTIVFLFWTITALGRRIHEQGADNKQKHVPPKGLALQAIFGAGVLGALVFTFSDSFWFSAVEAEVYGVSSLCTAVIVWAILRWERIEDKQLRWRWLILMSYIVGLSIGVHLLGLVTLPAVALLIYYREYVKRPTNFGATIAACIGLVAVGVIMVGVIQGLPSIAAGFDITFVNQLGLPFYSGIICFLLLLFGGLILGALWTHRKQWALGSTLLLSIIFILLGYSSYMLVLIRSGDNPPIDENNPEDVLKFISYLKREQYGDRPFVYGPHFAAEPVARKRAEPVYRKEKDGYRIIDWEIEYEYDAEDESLFPRMYSRQDRHEEAYRDYVGLSEQDAPTYAQHIQFLLGYQVGYMYIRYLMWNFVGRESDYEGADWLSPIDALRTFWEKIPSDLSTNKGRNNYWALPFLLGLLGAFYQGFRDYQGFRFVLLLFLLMGVGLVFYLNMPPEEPRERDYIYTGSYYAFAIWVGLAFMSLRQWISSWLRNKRWSLVLSVLLAVWPVVLMAKENWDDHDRSGRYFSVDWARNLLESCRPNAILFTGGDNDTFPLWYAQEVEGIRTDVRVVVLSYFNTDWYIEQMMRPAYRSAPLPFTLDKARYAEGGPNDFLRIYAHKDMRGQPIALAAYMDLLRKEDKRIQLESSTGSYYNMIPAREVVLEVDTAKVRAAGILSPSLDSLLTDRIYIRLEGNYLEKKDLAILDLIVAQDWSRPIYFNHTSLRGIGMDLEPYVVQEGMAYCLLPVFNDGETADYKLMYDGMLVDTERMYENVLRHFKFRGLQDEQVYLSEDYRSFVFNHREALSSLVAAFYKQGDIDRAQEVLHCSLEWMPDRTVPYDGYGLSTVAVALAVGEKQVAYDLADKITARARDWLQYHPSGRKIRHYTVTIKNTARLFAAHGDREAAIRYRRLLRE